MNLLDSYQYNLPDLCFLTDDPYRVKMIAAHYLDNVDIFTETRGQVGLKGEFNNVPIIVLSAGIGKISTMAYLTEVCMKNHIRRVIYLGDCITQEPDLPAGSITCISKAYEDEVCYHAAPGLLQCIESIGRDKGINACQCAAVTNDNYYIDKKYNIIQDSKVIDFTTSAIYRLNKLGGNMEVLSILNVCENISTNEAIGESVRQSGCHSAITLALWTLIFKGI